MNKKMPERRALFLSVVLLLSFWATLRLGVAPVEAARISDVRNTKHNFSAGSSYTVTGTVPGTDQLARNISASSENQVCVFCHTPHAATTAQAPLWNRKVAGQGYTQNYVMYDSSSLDADQVQGSLNQPGGSSKLCLSCHDGTMAIGSVNVLNGAGSGTTPGTVSVPMTGGPNMPVGSGTATGFTRNLGADLSNDHPISVSYNDTLATRDGEMRNVSNKTLGTPFPAGYYSRFNVMLGTKDKTNRPILKLEPTGPAGNEAQVQCATCHDPHLRETNASTVGNQKFLRLNRFQQNAVPTASGFNIDNDIICLACHNKNRGNDFESGTGAWSYSAHANPLVADELYSQTAADQREFPRNLPVWKAGCLNCHDTHTVQGSRRLLREGTDSTAVPKSGGNPALEETCFQCHDGGTKGTLQSSSTVPNIKQDFDRSIHMPIRSTEQGAGTEVHDINSNFTDAFNTCNTATSKCGKDLLEPRGNLGAGNLNNRHAECTDCHNPHRVVKFKDFRGNPAGTISGTPDASGTHPHVNDATITHSNIASGVLRGSWGVEPTYSSASFHSLPSGYVVKRGDPGTQTDTASTATYVTREYQICLKCHSDYAYSDDNAYPNSNNRPQLGGVGRTPSDTPNGHSNFKSYTNQAKEFQAPAGHNVAVGSVSLGTAAGANLNANNHRSWHPVMAPTGRTGRAGKWIAPWNDSGTGGKAGRAGNQTMYCSDCHGSGTADATAIPDSGNAWGPHGSGNNFLLKGNYNTSTGTGDTNALCFKCHDYTAYANGGGGTGFSLDIGKDGHTHHKDKIGKMRCNWCHVAVPHGWKNRNLLVNLNDVGPEDGQTAGTAKNGPYTSGPYYRNAMVKISSFPTGNWSDTNCNGGKNGMTNNCSNPP